MKIDASSCGDDRDCRAIRVRLCGVRVALSIACASMGTPRVQKILRRVVFPLSKVLIDFAKLFILRRF